MAQTLDIVLLLALPASGKSEVRKYLANLSPEACRDDFHMGPTVQLDDFPYVHMMRRIDDELARLGQLRVYFHTGDHPFQDSWEWGTLIELINEDYADLVARRVATPVSAAEHLFARFDAAAVRAEARPKMNRLPEGVRRAVAEVIEKEARALLDEKHANYPDSLEGRTLVIEFARGGADGSALPLKAPFGYGHSLPLLSADILAKARILYIWVTPEESRRKNFARTDPNDPGSILHHGVPIQVMVGDYGTDDMDWLVQHSGRPDTVRVDAHGTTWWLPVGRFDNRVDKTSFIRNDKAAWKPEEVAAVHQGLRSALDRIAKAV